MSYSYKKRKVIHTKKGSYSYKKESYSYKKESVHMKKKIKESKKTRGGNRRVRGGNRRVRGGNFRSRILALCDLHFLVFFWFCGWNEKKKIFMTQVNPAVFWPHAV